MKSVLQLLADLLAVVVSTLWDTIILGRSPEEQMRREES
jgi:hypothetical protein